MKDREIACKFYEYEHKCGKGRDAVFAKTCQHCGLYAPKLGTRPARVDNRRKKLEKIERRERY